MIIVFIQQPWCIRPSTLMYMYANVCIWSVCTASYTYACMYVVCVWYKIYICDVLCMYVYTYICRYPCVCIHVYVCMYLCICGSLWFVHMHAWNMYIGTYHWQDDHISNENYVHTKTHIARANTCDYYRPLVSVRHYAYPDRGAAESRPKSAAYVPQGMHTCTSLMQTVAGGGQCFWQFS